jgi:hypothetical protein
VAIELPHAGQQGGVMPLHFGQPEVDAGIERVGGRLGQHVGQVVEAVPDGIQHGGLQPDSGVSAAGSSARTGVLECVEEGDVFMGSALTPWS